MIALSETEETPFLIFRDLSLYLLYFHELFSKNRTNTRTK